MWMRKCRDERTVCCFSNLSRHQSHREGLWKQIPGLFSWKSDLEGLEGVLRICVSVRLPADMTAGLWTTRGWELAQVRIIQPQNNVNMLGIQPQTTGGGQGPVSQLWLERQVLAGLECSSSVWKFKATSQSREVVRLVWRSPHFAAPWKPLRIL